MNVTTQERDSSQVASEIQEKLAGLLGAGEIDGGEKDRAAGEEEGDQANVH